MARVTVFGAGYVGLGTALAFGQLGHETICVEINPIRLNALADSRDPLGEPNFAELLSSRTVRFAESDEQLGKSEVVFIAVGTPMSPSGTADLGQIQRVASTLATSASRNTVIVIRSTVPVGTADSLAQSSLRGFEIVSNPEFLREGRAWYDTVSPSRLVLGSELATPNSVIDELYAPLASGELARLIGLTPAPIPVLWMTNRSAELTKYVANAFLATKLSFANEVADLAALARCDVQAVLAAVGADPRIGTGHLRPGLGWGGSCFPKDTRALAALADGHDFDFVILKATIQQNDQHIARFARAVMSCLKSQDVIAVLGLAFKAGTSDTRDSPALRVIQELKRYGLTVRAYDPAVRISVPGVDFLADSASAAYAGADATLIATEWPEFGRLDLKDLSRQMRGRLLFDGRMMIDVASARDAGLDYRGTSTGLQPID